jgi:hypothetical protein
MDNPTDRQVNIKGKLIAVLLDQDEYPSNVGEVAAVSDEQILVIRRDKNALVGFQPGYVDMADCRKIEYEADTAWYRIVVAVIGFTVAAGLAVMLLLGTGKTSEEITPLLIGSIMCLTFGVRFVTSTKRHIIRFVMPDEVLKWKSPPIDFKSRAESAHAVRTFAHGRGLLAGTG